MDHLQRCVETARSTGQGLRAVIAQEISTRSGKALTSALPKFDYMNVEECVKVVRGLKFLGEAVNIVSRKVRCILNAMEELSPGERLERGFVWCDGTLLSLSQWDNAWPAADPGLTAEAPSTYGWEALIRERSPHLARAFVNSMAISGLSPDGHADIVPAATAGRAIYLEGGWALEVNALEDVDFHVLAGALTLAGIAFLPNRFGTLFPAYAYGLKYAYRENGRLVLGRFAEDKHHDDFRDVVRALWAVDALLLVAESGIYRPSEISCLWGWYVWDGSNMLIHAISKGRKNGPKEVIEG